MRNLRTLSVLFVMFILFPAESFSAPAPDAAYESLKARYMRLRNTDREISKQVQWLDVIHDLESFAEENRNHKNSPVALSQAGAMLLEIYRVTKDESMLQKSLQTFKKISIEFSKSNEADDALFKLSEIYEFDLNDKDKAAELVDQIIEKYPSGDMVEAARLKKKGLSGETEDSDDEQGVLEGKIEVIIDPGHGGEDFGAVGVGGLYEKDVVLDISHKVKKILENKYKLKVALTREIDEFVPLYERTGIANESGAQVFVSIHANASEKKNFQGLEIYYLDNTSDSASKKLAERENSSMQFEGPEADLRYMLSDLIQDTKMNDSLKLAGVLGDSIVAGVGGKGFEIKNHGIKKAPFYVLVGAYMPCVLVEIGFIDHHDEGQRLAEKAFRDAMADAFAEGIVKFLNNK